MKGKDYDYTKAIWPLKKLQVAFLGCWHLCPVWGYTRMAAGLSLPLYTMQLDSLFGIFFMTPDVGIVLANSNIKYQFHIRRHNRHINLPTTNDVKNKGKDRPALSFEGNLWVPGLLVSQARLESVCEGPQCSQTPFRPTRKQQRCKKI